MCYNARVSLNTYIFGTIIAIILLLLNNLSILSIYFAFTISLIQLMEYLAWININNNNDDDNERNIYYLSILGLSIIIIQILIINVNYLEGIERIILIIIILIFFSYIFYYNYKNKKFNITVGENGHLIWHWVDIEYLNVIGLFFWLYPFLRNNDYLIFILISISILFSVYNFYKYKTFGSMWCYIGNLVWILLLFNAIILLIR